MVALRWRGSWMAAALRLFGLLSLSLPFSLFRFCFSFSSFFFFCFRFWFQYSLLSLPCVLSLSLRSPLSPSVSPKKIRPSLSFGLPIYRKKNMEQVCFSCVPSITQRLVGHWGEFGGGGGEERDAGEFSKFLPTVLLKRGGKEMMNSVVQNDTVLLSFFFFFFFFLYIYETASF